MSDPTETELQQAIRHLGSRKKSVREEAERKLLQHPAVAIELLLDVLKIEANKSPKRATTGMVVALIGSTLFLSFSLRSLLSGGIQEFMETFGRMGYLCTLGIWVGIASLRPSNRQLSLARVLVKFEDVRIVGPLVEACVNTDDKEVQKLVRERLFELLPGLQPEHASHFTEHQYISLHSYLLKSDNIEFTLAMLKAYERLGDPRLLPMVERLARDEDTLLAAGRASRVRTAAKECNIDKIIF